MEPVKALQLPHLMDVVDEALREHVQHTLFRRIRIKLQIPVLRTIGSEILYPLLDEMGD